MVVDLITILEWCGALAGLCGATLLSTNTRISRWGWLFFLAANFAVIVVAFSNNLFGLLLQQIGFSFTSLLGIYRSGLWGVIKLRMRNLKPAQE